MPITVYYIDLFPLCIEFKVLPMISVCVRLIGACQRGCQRVVNKLSNYTVYNHTCNKKP